jgi:hypothetical protein
MTKKSGRSKRSGRSKSIKSANPSKIAVEPPVDDRTGKANPKTFLHEFMRGAVYSIAANGPAIISWLVGIVNQIRHLLL